MQLSYWLGFCCCFSSSTVCLWWSLILCGWCIWVFTHLYKSHLISWIASKNYFIRNLCHCSVFCDVCPRGCFLSKLMSVVRWQVFPFMTWEIMAGCRLISLAEKRTYHCLVQIALENKDMGYFEGAVELKSWLG